MKFCMATVVLLIIGSAVMGFGQKPRPSFAIAIGTPKSNVTANRGMRLQVSMTNISDRNIVIHVLNGEGWERLGFEIDVRDKAGNAVEETAYGRQAQRREPTPPHWPGAGMVRDGESRLLKPGEALKQEILLSKLYKLAQPGEYTVQLRRMDPVSKIMVKSNRIAVTVTP